MRIAIISDIHEDYQSLQKVTGKIMKAGYDQLVCLGDISGYSVPYYNYLATRDARACLAHLRELDAIIVPGNHDYYAAKRLPAESPAFSFPDNWFALDHSQHKEIAKEQIWLHEESDLDPLYDKSDIDYLRSIDEYHVFSGESFNSLFSHYAYPNMAGFSKGFYMSAADFRQHFDFMDKQSCNIGFVGHAHARGFFSVVPGKFTHHRYGSMQLKKFPVVIGIPPVTRHKKRSGFCIFDTDQLKVRIIRY